MFDLRNRIRACPNLYYRFRRVRNGKAVSSLTEIVIEGYPRSANTFSLHSFLLAQKRDMVIAHHLHAAAQVLRGIELQLPIIVLIRKPKEAILSNLVFNSGRLKMKRAILDYLGFYLPIIDYRDEICVADFREVTHDFREVVKRLNTAFGQNFILPDRDFGFRNAVDAKLRSIDEKKPRAQMTRPSVEKEKMKEWYSRELEAQYGNLLQKCEIVFDTFVDAVR